MNSKGEQIKQPNSGKPNEKPETGKNKTSQATMPRGKTWLWFMGILLANFILGRVLMPGAVKVQLKFE
ncbi:MAG TPA: hypothetical protein PKW76_11040 [bacterium]|nr:hypothetical protein [bacterium]HPG46206.1 hypothetical protein [bacterium]HPM98600.1 hypothetical protein [bacterium]